MQHARTHSRKPGTGLEPLASAAPARLRFDPVLHLETGDAVGALARTDERFEERAVFGPAGQVAESACPAIWLAARLEDAAIGVGLLDIMARPIHVEAPLAALAHANTALACDAAVRRTRLCPQEFVIELQDAALAASSTDCVARVEGLRRRGFRVGLDARTSWSTPLCANLRLMLDSVRISAPTLDTEPDVQDLAEVAHAAGLSVIADKARWQDAYWLGQLGVEYGVQLKADA